MPKIDIPEKICSHCGGITWYFAPNKKTYECFIKVSERKIKWQHNNYDRYLTLAKKRRDKFRELNPLPPRSKMSCEERKTKSREYNKKKYRENPVHRERVCNYIKKYNQLYPEKKKKHLEKFKVKHAVMLKEKARLNSIKNAAKLTNTYLKNLIVQGTSISRKNIPQELIEIKRKQLILTRQIKNNGKDQSSDNNHKDNNN